MSSSGLYDYSDAYILAEGTITVAKAASEDQQNNNANKIVILKNCAPFTKCVSRINNRQVKDAHDIDEVKSMYNLIECTDIYSKISAILLQYCRDELTLAANATTSFTVANAITDSFKTKKK